MEDKLPAHLGITIDQRAADQPTNQRPTIQTDIEVHREVTLQVKRLILQLASQ